MTLIARIHFRVYYKLEGDLFQHFETLQAEDKIPSFEDLEKDATIVYRAFCTHHSGERALDPVGDAPEGGDEHPNTTRWKHTIPMGSPWCRPGYTTPLQSTSSPCPSTTAADNTSHTSQALSQFAPRSPSSYYPSHASQVDLQPQLLLFFRAN